LQGFRRPHGVPAAPVGRRLGARGRRRLLQGPDHGARHQRRAARRRAPGRRRSPAAATARSPSTRRGATRLSIDLFETTEAIASSSGIMQASRATTAA
jgi:hypothetical protein